MFANFIIKIIDFFYTPFQRFFPETIFRYGVCGAANMVLDWLLYFIVYNFILRHHNLSFGYIVVSSHIASLAIVFPITLLTGFWLNKYVTFSHSVLSSSQQLFRYILIVAINLLINYFGLKICVEILLWYPTPSKMFITILTVLISFVGQKYFSFKS